jgi:hypothetical protein
MTGSAKQSIFRGKEEWIASPLTLLAMTDDDLDYFFRISSTLYGPPPDVVR